MTTRTNIGLGHIAATLPFLVGADLVRDPNAVEQALDDAQPWLSALWLASRSALARRRPLERRITAALETGMAAINDFGGVTYMAQDLTFGGVKASGYGRMNGREGLRSMCNVKAVVDDRFPLGIPNKVFPVAEKDYGTFSGLIELRYGRGFAQRARGLLALLGVGRKR